MDKINAVHPPFYGMSSSCSTKFPEKFRWVYKNFDLSLPTVFCDDSIFSMDSSFKDRYAWIVESPAINQNIINTIKINRKLISHQYKFLFTCSEELVGLEKNFIYCPAASNIPWVAEYSGEKSKLCSMFASPKAWLEGHRFRHQIAEKYKDRIDLFGGALGSPRLGEGIHPDKAEGINPYMFSIVIENVKCDKYYTEKVTDCFATKTIPVYWGTRKISEDFNTDGIIFLEDFDINSLNKDLYDSKINAINDNFERVKKLKMADDCLFERIV